MRKTIITSSILSTFLTIAMFTLFASSIKTDNKSLFNREVGSISIWGGSQSDIPSGWVLCDGRELHKSTYNKLYSKISTYWNTDKGQGADFFRVPDLRGVFLRGANGSRNDEFKDPEKDSRIRLETKSSHGSNEVGSFQMDAFQGHRHFKSASYVGGNDPTNNSISWEGTAIRTNVISNEGLIESYDDNKKSYGVPKISSESRGKNVYVHFIIYTGVR